MGTLVRITLYAQNEAIAAKGFASAFSRIGQLNGVFSDYDPHSELSRLPVGVTAKVSPDLFAILQLAQRISRETGGAFDVTLGPLTNLWREARRQSRLPDPAAVEAARVRCGYQNLILDSRRHTLILTKPGMRLDLGAIAKGYAAQAALDTLRRQGLPRALVAMSGDLAIGDPPPGRKGWRIQVEPNPGQSQVLTLRNRAVSTSGDREQFVEIEGRRYSHILDARTGQPLINQPGVTVIGRGGALTDALATAFCVLGKTQSTPLARHVRVIW